MDNDIKSEDENNLLLNENGNDENDENNDGDVDDEDGDLDDGDYYENENENEGEDNDNDIEGDDEAENEQLNDLKNNEKNTNNRKIDDDFFMSNAKKMFSEQLMQHNNDGYNNKNMNHNEMIKSMNLYSDSTNYGQTEISSSNHLKQNCNTNGNEHDNYITQKLNSMNNSNPKKHTRDELVFLTKIFDRCENYEDAIETSLSFIKMKPILSSDERLTFSNAFKNLLIIKRNSLKYLEDLFKKETKNQSKTEKEGEENIRNCEYLDEIITKVEDELHSLIGLMLEILDEMLIPNSKKPEAQVFYLKLKADYYRYKAEISKGDDKEIAIDLAEHAYNDAYLMSEEQLPITSLTRVGLAVNFSIFYYEHKDMLDEAIMIARSCFDDAIKSVDDIEPEKAKDYILLVHLLKENVIFWNTEKAEEESSQN